MRPSTQGNGAQADQIVDLQSPRKSIDPPRELICFGEDWGRHPSSAQHLVGQLLGRFRVIWFNSLGWRTPRFSHHDFSRAMSKLRAAARGVERPHPDLLVYTPLVVPWYRSAAVRWFNAGLLYRAIRRLARRHGFSRYSLMTSTPPAADVFKRMRGVRRVYYCADDYTSFPGIDPQLGRVLEASLLSVVDVVVTTSRKLYEAKSALHPNVTYLPHGVDVEHFAKAVDTATPVPEDLGGLPRPIIGYFGLITDWVDLSLVRELALARPAWSIVLIGGSTKGPRPLQGLPNVHLLGPRPYASLPGYCRGFDVAIIPFLKNSLTAHANPLKLREYLAAGKPIVSVPIPEVSQFGELVHVADSVTEFVHEIERCLSEDPSLCKRRMASMRTETWASRAAGLEAVL